MRNVIPNYWRHKSLYWKVDRRHDDILSESSSIKRYLKIPEGPINSRELEDRQYNVEREKAKMTNNGRQDITEKTKDWATRTPIKSRKELRCSKFVCASGVQHILCCVVLRLVYPMLAVSLDCPFLIAPLVFSNVYLSCVLCILCWQFLWIVHFWLLLWYSLTFICPVSCVPYVVRFSGLSISDCSFGIL